MQWNPIQQLIVDLVDEYDDYGYCLMPELLKKYEAKIEELYQSFDNSETRESF